MKTFKDYLTEKKEEIDVKVSKKYNIVPYGNKAMEIQSNGKSLKIFKDKDTDIENWKDAVSWATQNKNKIKE